MEQAVIQLLLVYYVIVNTAGFFIMWYDKQKARKAKRRTSEQALFTWASFGGAAGMLISSRLFRHKTQKAAFKIGLPLFILMHAALSVILVWAGGVLGP
ncbi:hypothetical protein CR205_01230 [Alteribacter lacisalsi]|uniref:DUF1294 domain-containing protein n=1 Tax=Alteribacter lacisalsi TaxID=2045244 RepID=A0A2W0H7Y2_9BACI|nr:DUF1294 domain-containing protein [Alteribacter lacisalsi]PYZ97257.1 hypothetical protein CR205_01230 [Alteribacter lacisalsi]